MSISVYFQCHENHEDDVSTTLLSGGDETGNMTAHLCAASSDCSPESGGDGDDMTLNSQLRRRIITIIAAIVNIIFVLSHFRVIWLESASPSFLSVFFHFFHGNGYLRAFVRISMMSVTGNYVVIDQQV